ncbi:Ribosomal RNA large subunit methyltransferase H [Gammaproteobacteria bacterium]
MPAWVTEGFREYAKRLPPALSLTLVEVPMAARTRRGDVARWRQEEGARLLQALPRDCHLVALDVKGRGCSTEALARTLSDWMTEGRPVAFLVGGPDGLDEACLARAAWRWSLSPLTFPHPLVRVILVEQIYRALSLLRHHPYHRA